MVLKNLRNHTHLELDLSSDSTILVGKNGVGKTNCLLGIRAGLQGSVSSQVGWKQLLQEGAEYGHINWSEGMHEGRVSFGGEKGNPEYFLSEKKMGRKKYVDTHNWRTVFIDSLTLNILYLTPSLRRSFIDGVIASVTPGYMKTLKNMKHVMTQRNHLLKRIREGLSKRDELGYWDREYVKASLEVWQHRYAYMQQVLSSTYDHLHDQLPIIGTYQTRYMPDMTMEHMLMEIVNRYDQDIRSGRTTYGPHLDDFFFSHDLEADEVQTSIETLSRGQNKMLLLELVRRTVAYVKDSQPSVKLILMLDDVFSELDEEHIQSLLDQDLADKLVMTTQPNHLPEEMSDTGIKVIEIS